MTTHDDVFTAILRIDFYSFLRQCFTTLCPGVEFKDNWHLYVLSSELTAVARGENRRLIVNMPPRSLKSVATSVALVAWYLGHNPSAEVICASYSADLSQKFAFDCRKVMMSEWYEATFPTRVDVRRSAVHDFRTIQGGARLAASVGGQMTGRGADLIVIDDPAKPDEMLSEVQRVAINQWFPSTVLSRLNDKTRSAIVVAMQRLHVQDLTGTLLRDGGGVWRHLKLAATAPQQEIYRYQTVRGTKTYVRAEGEVLHAEREPTAALVEMRATLGSYFYEAQYQQEPMLPDGNLINIRWFPRYDQPPEEGQVFQSWDTANKVGDLNDYSVCTTWRVVDKKIYLLDLFRRRLEYPDLKRAVIEQAALHRPTTIVVEDSSAGTPLIQELRRDGVYNVKPIKAIKDKQMRIRAQTAVMENGLVVLPKEAPWLPAYETEMMLFPHAAHDDQVDSTAQALAYWQQELQEPNLLVFMRMEMERLGLSTEMPPAYYKLFGK
jgi:predicted phage terminase large subunit-like protein